MASHLFAFTSLSEVQRIRNGMMQSGGFVDMIRTPRRLRDKGCGFSLRATDDMADAVRAYAIACGIIIRAEAEETEEDTLRRTFSETDPGA